MVEKRVKKKKVFRHCIEETNIGDKLVKGNKNMLTFKIMPHTITTITTSKEAFGA